MEFHKLWVIESLRQNDIKTGQGLVDGQLKKARQAQPTLEVEFRTPATKQELLNLLQEIRDEARAKGIYPMLHFECHGNKDGLGTSNDEFIGWEELRKVCIEINHACRLNLVVVLAACNGIYFIRTSEKLDGAPFWAAIGPDKTVYDDDVEIDFGAFYQKLFEKLDGDAALLALNRGQSGTTREYHFFSVEGIFFRAYAKYHRDHCSGEGLRKRVEKLLLVSMQHPKIAANGEAWARQRLQERLSTEDEKEGFDTIKNRFFFINDFPENAKRFLVSHADVMTHVSSSP